MRKIDHAGTRLADVWPKKANRFDYVLTLPPGVKLAKWRKQVLWTKGAANRRN